MCARAHVCVRVCLCVCERACVCVSVRVCVFMREREREKERDKQEVVKVIANAKIAQQDKSGCVFVSFPRFSDSKFEPDRSKPV